MTCGRGEAIMCHIGLVTLQEASKSLHSRKKTTENNTFRKRVGGQWLLLYLEYLSRQQNGKTRKQTDEKWFLERKKSGVWSSSEAI